MTGRSGFDQHGHFRVVGLLTENLRLRIYELTFEL